LVISCLIRKNEYRDSIVLMRISSQLEGMEGIKKASVIMATDNNKKLLEDAGLLTNEIKMAGPNDLVIAVEAETEELAMKAFSALDNMLAEKPWKETGLVCRTFQSAAAIAPDANLVLISVPGPFAAREAMNALNSGKHVFIFSNGVPIEEEVRLKKFAEKKNLLVMGPDCGTAIINGVGIGFSNVVRRGPIGIVGASGTGMQQVSCLVDEVGVSQAIGTGSRDLTEAVGAITTCMGLRLLDEDPDTRVVVVISKPPAPKIARKVLKLISSMKKPLVVNFLGYPPAEIELAGATPAATLEEAAVKAMALARGEKPKEMLFTQKLGKIRAIVERETESLSSCQRYIRGLFSGGTFCYEAMLILRDLIGKVYSNIPLDRRLELADAHSSRENTCIDMGTGIFTAGRPHPMIDFRFRKERLLKEASDPETAVILLDIVLGHGANPDPAGEIAPAIKQAKEIAMRGGRYLSVVASVCGTRGDPQNLVEQEKKLEEVGVVLMPSNAQAARMAALIATRGKVWRRIK